MWKSLNNLSRRWNGKFQRKDVDDDILFMSVIEHVKQAKVGQAVILKSWQKQKQTNKKNNNERFFDWWVEKKFNFIFIRDLDEKKNSLSPSSNVSSLFWENFETRL